MSSIPKRRLLNQGERTQRFTLDSVRTATLSQRVCSLLDLIELKEDKIDQIQTENENLSKKHSEMKTTFTKLLGFLSGLYSLLPESKMESDVKEGIEKATCSSIERASESILSHFSELSQIDTSKLQDYMTSNELMLMNNQLHKQIDEVDSRSKMHESDLETNKITISRLTREIADYKEEINKLKQELITKDHEISEMSSKQSSPTSHISPSQPNTFTTATSPETMKSSNDNSCKKDDVKPVNSSNLLNMEEIKKEGDQMASNGNTSENNEENSPRKEANSGVINNNNNNNEVIDSSRSSNINNLQSHSSDTSEQDKPPTEQLVIELNCKINFLEQQNENYRKIMGEYMTERKNRELKIAKLKEELKETRKIMEIVRKEFESFKNEVDQRFQLITSSDESKQRLVDELETLRNRMVNIESSYKQLMLNEKENTGSQGNDSKENMEVETLNKKLASRELRCKELAEELEIKTGEAKDVLNKYNELLKKTASGDGVPDADFFYSQIEEMDSALTEKESILEKKEREIKELKEKLKQLEDKILELMENLNVIEKRELIIKKESNAFKSTITSLLEDSNSVANAKVQLENRIVEMEKEIHENNMKHIKDYTRVLKELLGGEDIDSTKKDKKNNNSDSSNEIMNQPEEEDDEYINRSRCDLVIKLKALKKELSIINQDNEATKESIKNMCQEIDKKDEEINVLKTIKNQYLKIFNGSENMKDLIMLERRIEELEKKQKCNICHERDFCVVLRSCGHVLCQECINKNIESRTRRCPSCMEKFSTSDVIQIKK